MATGKRYYWLKLKEDFFCSVRIKKLRNMAGGDTYLIIYLKLQLVAMKQNGMIQFEHLESTIAEELALALDESVDNVKVTLAFLVNCGLAETNDETSYIFLPGAVESVGSETSSTARVRAFRDRQKALHCNADETQVKRIGNGEIEKETDIETEKANDPEGGEEGNNISIHSSIPSSPPSSSPPLSSFVPPSPEDVEAYCRSQGFGLDPRKFYAHYQSRNWIAGGELMKDWRACLRRWEEQEKHLSSLSNPRNIRSYSQRDNTGAQEEAMEQMREMIRASKREQGVSA